MNVLERHAVRRIAPQGQMFNPHQHQAVMEAQDPSVAPGTIVQVYQNGYVIEDRVLRPAMVVVAKGGAKPGRPAEPPAEQAAHSPPPSAQSQPQRPPHLDDEDTPPPPDRDIIL